MSDSTMLSCYSQMAPPSLTAWHLSQTEIMDWKTGSKRRRRIPRGIHRIWKKIKINFCRTWGGEIQRTEEVNDIRIRNSARFISQPGKGTEEKYRTPKYGTDHCNHFRQKISAGKRKTLFRDRFKAFCNSVDGGIFQKKSQIPVYGR